jgi:hypothetical protein
VHAQVGERGGQRPIPGGQRACGALLLLLLLLVVVWVLLLLVLVLALLLALLLLVLLLLRLLVLAGVAAAGVPAAASTATAAVRRPCLVSWGVFGCLTAVQPGFPRQPRCSKEPVRGRDRRGSRAQDARGGCAETRPVPSIRRRGRCRQRSAAGRGGRGPSTVRAEGHGSGRSGRARGARPRAGPLTL